MNKNNRVSLLEHQSMVKKTQVDTSITNVILEVVTANEQGEITILETKPYFSEPLTK